MTMKEGLVQESCNGLDVADWSLHRKSLRMQHVVTLFFNAQTVLYLQCASGCVQKLISGVEFADGSFINRPVEACRAY